MDWRDLEELAVNIGFSYKGQSGSHRKYAHPLNERPLMIPTNSNLKGTDNTLIGILRDTWKEMAHPVEKKQMETPVVNQLQIKKDWRVEVRSTREKSSLSLRQVGEQMGYPTSIATNAVYDFEKGKRLFTQIEFRLWCKVFHLDPKLQTWMTEFETRPDVIERRESLFKPEAMEEDSLKDILGEEEAPAITEIIEPPVIPEVKKSEEIAPIQSRIRDLPTMSELTKEIILDLERQVHEGEQAQTEYERLAIVIQKGNEARPKLQGIYEWMDEWEHRIGLLNK